MKQEWKLSSFDLFSLNMTIKGAWIYDVAPDYNKMKEALREIQKMYPLLGGRYNETLKPSYRRPRVQDYGRPIALLLKS